MSAPFQNAPAVPPDAPWIALADYALVQLVGPHALNFAQAQFASDCANLPLGCWQWSCWLTAQGRVRALFALFRAQQDQVWLICPGGDSTWLAKELYPYIIRRKLTVQPLRGWSVIAAMAAPRHAQGSVTALGDDGRIEFDLGAPSAPRCLALVPADHIRVDDSMFTDEWKECDLTMGLAHLTPDQAGQWTANQLALQRLNAVSVSKGCYPGQEIVARTHFLGKNKRVSYLLQTSQPTPSGTNVYGPDETLIGTVVDASQRVALAVLPIDWQHWPVHTTAGVAEPRPMLEGLARFFPSITTAPTTL